MPINPDAVGSTSEPSEASWTSKDALLYAVGIGAGTDELAYTTENTNGVQQQVFPTFPVVIGWGRGSAMGNIGSFNPAMLVHGQQGVTLHQPLKPTGTVISKTRVTEIIDKGEGKGAVLYSERTIDDKASGARIASIQHTTFCRADGGFGGPPRQQLPPHPIPERAPDLVLPARDDRRVRDRDAERMPEQRRHREPVRERADHAALGRRAHVPPAREVLLEDERDDEDDRHEQQGAERDRLHGAEPAIPLLISGAQRAVRDAGHSAILPRRPSRAGATHGSSGPSHAFASAPCTDSGSDGWNRPASTSR